MFLSGRLQDEGWWEWRDLKGIGLDVLWPEALALLGWGIAILTLATLRSTKRLA